MDCNNIPSYVACKESEYNPDMVKACHGGKLTGSDFYFSGVRLDLITATAVTAGLASIVFGFLTNLPVALA